jgi:hypothetical protein
MAHLFRRSRGRTRPEPANLEEGGWRRSETVCRPSENSRRVSIREGKAVTVKVPVATANQHVLNGTGGPTPSKGPDPQSAARKGTASAWRTRAWQSA